MKKYYITAFAIMIVNLSVFAQVRYLDEVFSNIQIDSNVAYGSNNNVYSINQTLRMDIYEPAGDTLTARPLVILAHGGSFIGGDRKLPDVVAIATALAKRGYVCASIQYRLGVNILSGNPIGVEFTNAVWRGTQDGRAAVRYFRKNFQEGNTYKIDTANIYAGGISAGGVLALHLAFFDKPSELAGITVDTSLLGGFDGNSGNAGFSWRVKGVVNLSGAIGNVSWLNDNKDVAICNVHGDQDQTVPYGSADFYYSGLRVAYLQGSFSIDSAARINGMYSQLKTFIGQDHVPFSSNATYMDTTVKFTAEFLYNMVAGNIRASVKERNKNSFSFYPNPTTGYVTISRAPAQSNIRVTDIKGTVVYISTTTQPETMIDTKTWDNGIYFIQVGNSAARKLMVQH